MNENNLINYYNKFNEDKRLKTRHGIIEYTVSMKYLYDYLNLYKNPKIIDIGAGTGAYSIPLADDGYEVTAVELVKHNLRVIQKRSNNVKVIQGNATNLSFISNEEFDIVILFGPMYHLISQKEKIKALSEAKRICKKDGLIFVAYIMNEYGIIKHGFFEKSILEDIKEKKVDKDYKINSTENDLYSFVRLEDINQLNEAVGLERIKIFTPDGLSNYFRKNINELSEEQFLEYIKYHLSICEKIEMLGYSTHIVDIVKIN